MKNRFNTVFLLLALGLVVFGSVQTIGAAQFARPGSDILSTDWDDPNGNNNNSGPYCSHDKVLV